MKYWRRYPPQHIALASLARSFGAMPAAPRRTAGAGDQPSVSAMEGVAMLLGPPTHKFRPPCRMLAPVQAPAPAEPDGVAAP